MDLYVSSKQESGSGDGSQLHPFDSVQHLLKIMDIKCDDSKIDYKIFIEQEDNFKEISKAQLKKEIKTFKTNQKKTKPTVVKVEKKCDNVTVIHKSLEVAKRSKINKLKDLRGHRVMIQGWVQHIRKQGKKLLFVTVKDKTGSLQCLFENNFAKDATNLTCESSVCVYGVIEELPEGKDAEGGHELKTDHWELINLAPSGGIESVLNIESHSDVLFDNRHLMLRGENASKVVSLQNATLRAFRRYYEDIDFTEVMLPAFVNNQSEGGSTLFHVKHLGDDAYLTQSNQLYLETMLPIVGECYSIAKSFRNENSRTRRHLSEYIHIEAEMPFISFDNLLDSIEDMLVGVSRLVAEYDDGKLLKVHPHYRPLEKPIRRMTYADAVEFLRDNAILKPDGLAYEFGDDIPEGAERAMLAKINEPLMLTRFPWQIKAFYMSRCADDDRVTESVDVLLPGVGEVVGGSMRIWHLEELMAAIAREKLDPSHYYWYSDQRRFGSVPHGGYGLGFERFLTWMLNKDHIRDVSVYPRYMGRIKP